MAVTIPDFIRPHHRAAIEKVTDYFEKDPRYLAVIFGGSVVKNLARENSDIDIQIICTDEEYERRAASNDFWFWAGRDLADYEGGYVDGKFLNLKFVEDVADHGSETARSAFVGAFVGFSRVPGLAETVARIAVYPEHEREEKMKTFLCQIMLLVWFFGEAEKRNDKYLLSWSTTNLILFGSRLILAYNRVLFPYHKWLMHRVAECPEKPENILELGQAVLDNPCKATAEAYANAIKNWQPWGVTIQEAVSRFMIDAEWNWRGQRAPLTDY